jgi:protein-arginine kinase activator protein McsA
MNRTHFMGDGCDTPDPDHVAALGLTMIDPRTSKPVVICIDADCPNCGWAERNFDTGTGLFGCSQCDYTSTEREA